MSAVPSVHAPADQGATSTTRNKAKANGATDAFAAALAALAAPPASGRTASTERPSAHRAQATGDPSASKGPHDARPAPRDPKKLPVGVLAGVVDHPAQPGTDPHPRSPEAASATRSVSAPAPTTTMTSAVVDQAATKAAAVTHLAETPTGTSGDRRPAARAAKATPADHVHGRATSREATTAPPAPFTATASDIATASDVATASGTGSTTATGSATATGSGNAAAAVANAAGRSGEATAHGRGRSAPLPGDATRVAPSGAWSEPGAAGRVVTHPVATTPLAVDAAEPGTAPASTHNPAAPTPALTTEQRAVTEPARTGRSASSSHGAASIDALARRGGRGEGGTSSQATATPRAGVTGTAPVTDTHASGLAPTGHPFPHGSSSHDAATTHLPARATSNPGAPTADAPASTPATVAPSVATAGPPAASALAHPPSLPATAAPTSVAPPGSSGMPANTLPGVASQLLSVLGPLRTSAAGTQRLTIVLHPEQLGDVTATLTLANRQLVVRLAASTSEGAAALRSALPSLQLGLSGAAHGPTVVLADAGGNGSGSGSGNPGSAGGQPAPRHHADPVVRPTPTPSPVAQAVATLTSARDRLLDVRL